ncbi:MAG TPA: carboxylesterase family protein [Caulobacteraceae bacterium]|nr:carboxylesterase family protein [Caulobacteraceae bacterium]
MTDTLEPKHDLARTAVVATSNGPVRGYRDRGLEIFKGLRYAAPPLGALRFAPPQRPAPWTQPADALSLGAPPIQVGVEPGGTTGGKSAGDPPAPGQPGTDEDCLFINVWTPGLTGKRPVMVWLHGGGFANGSGGAAMYDGEALARRGDAVIVTVNHRLNVFGYLHLGELGGHPSSGEAGMLDIVMVLEWVRDNIAAFGGDPGAVTIFGESGGGMKVSALLAMPAAAGLFHRAIIQSGPWLKAVSREAATKYAKAFLDALGLKPGELHKLQFVDTADIQAAATIAAPTDRTGDAAGSGHPSPA